MAEIEPMTTDTFAKPKKVSVRAARAHTFDGKSYVAGDIYDVDANTVETLQHQGMAYRAEPAEGELSAEELSKYPGGTPANLIQPPNTQPIKKSE